MVAATVTMAANVLSDLMFVHLSTAFEIMSYRAPSDWRWRGMMPNGKESNAWIASLWNIVCNLSMWTELYSASCTIRTMSHFLQPLRISGNSLVYTEICKMETNCAILQFSAINKSNEQIQLRQKKKHRIKHFRSLLQRFVYKRREKQEEKKNTKIHLRVLHFFLLCQFSCSRSVVIWLDYCVELNGTFSMMSFHASGMHQNADIKWRNFMN